MFHQDNNTSILILSVTCTWCFKVSRNHLLDLHTIRSTVNVLYLACIVWFLSYRSWLNFNWCCYFYMNLINESYFMINSQLKKIQYITAYNLSGLEREWLVAYLTDCQLLLSGCCRLRRCLPNRTAQWRVWTRTVRNPRPPSKACGRRPSRVLRAPQTLSWWVGDLNTIFLNVKYLSQLHHTGQNL